jgi:uncharacterized cupredoxin-like copper-binding protein
MKYRHILGLFVILSILMAVLAACGGASTAPSGSQEVQVTLSEYKITSSQTTFSPGTSYHYVVTNKGQTAHEFMMMPMGMNMGGMSMDEMHKVALHMIDNVAPGETKTFDYTFASSMMGQNFEFACHLPGHYEAGMQLPMMVNK